MPKIAKVKMPLSENARTIFDKRYAIKDDKGGPTETPEQAALRVAQNVASVTALYAPDGDLAKVDAAFYPWKTIVRQAAHLGRNPFNLTQAGLEAAAKQADRYYGMLVRRDFFPNSPTWTGAGTGLGQLAACFVLPIDDDLADSRSSIFETLKVAAAIQQTGGGNGFSFGRLRPNRTLVKRSMGKASGPVGFLHTYDAAFGWIAQGGTRRGANMGVLPVHHPDIRDFIAAKTEEGAVENFNISVAITDEFMRAVTKDGDFDLRWNGKTVETIRARDLFDTLIGDAWKLGDPGSLFIDRANQHNPCPQRYTLEATNPCVTGETWVMTEEGARQIWALEFDDERRIPPRVMVNGETYKAEFVKTGTKPVFSLMTREGYYLRLTGDHQVMTPAGWVEAASLGAGDKIVLHDHGIDLAWENPDAIYSGQDPWGFDEGYLSGLFVGDGTVGGPSDRRSMVLNVWNTDPGYESIMAVAERAARQHIENFSKRVRSDWRGWTGPHGNGWYRLTTKATDDLLMNFVADESGDDWGFSNAEHQSSDFYRGFLQGLFDADGHVETGNGGPNVRLSASNLDLLTMVQRMLLRLGMFSRIYPMKGAGSSLFPDGHGGVKEYPVRESWRLVISGGSAHTFSTRVGFGNTRKQEALGILLGTMSRGPYKQDFVATVASLVPDGEEEVFDARVEGVHAFDANGLYVHNCGEQWLPPYSNCCLGSINLLNFAYWVDPDDDDDGQWKPVFDWDFLRLITILAQNFLDDVVDANAYVDSVPELAEAAMGERRIGLGIMGLADAMAVMGLAYDSEQGRDFASQVMEFVHYHTMLASIERAKARGPFEWFSGSIYDLNNVPSRILGRDGELHDAWQAPKPLESHDWDFERPQIDWDRVRDGIIEHGIRNACLMTIAPTGTISNVADLQGSGCEPFFGLAYDRILTQDEQKITLTYANPLLAEVLRRNGKDDDEIAEIAVRIKANAGSALGVEGVPFDVQHAFPVAADVKPEDHVRMQAALQRFVDNSISKTINMPYEATVEDVGEVYRLAFDLGCKGITIYRQGSRQFEVLSTGAKAEQDTGDDWAFVHPHKIPEYAATEGLPSRTFPVSTPFGTAQVYITELTEHPGRPFDIRVGFGKAGNDKLADVEALGRAVSIALRAGVPVEVVVDQMEGIGGQTVMGFGPNRTRSVADGIARLLRRRYMEPVTEQISVTPIETPLKESRDPVADPTLVCPMCHLATVVNENGCQRCETRLGGCGDHYKCD